jgi:putative effector of murein hydrolase
VFAARLPAGFVKLVHPLVTTSAGLLSMVHGLALATNQDYKDILRSYKVGSLSPLKTGSGDIMLYALGPSVVSFATAMYGRRALLKANFLVVATGVLVGSLGSLYGTAAFVRLISLGSQMIRLSMVPRSVTTALAMVLASMLGGDVSIAAAVVSLTGIIGATFARTVLDYLKISDPVTRGLAVGASSQGLGVASIAGEPDAFPFAAMAMVLCAIVSTTLVSFPVVKDSILKIAGGV